MNDSPQDRALNELLELVGDADAAGTPFDEARARALAMQWPSLAAALANLLAAHDMRVPRPLRVAASIVNIGEGKVLAQKVVDAVRQGAWCFCAAGGNEGGRGHLKGEGGCSRWCGCAGAAYPHLHDGTMPGNPVIT